MNKVELALAAILVFSMTKLVARRALVDALEPLGFEPRSFEAWLKCYRDQQVRLAATEERKKYQEYVELARKHRFEPRSFESWLKCYRDQQVRLAATEERKKYQEYLELPRKHRFEPRSFETWLKCYRDQQARLAAIEEREK